MKTSKKAKTRGTRHGWEPSDLLEELAADEHRGTVNVFRIRSVEVFGLPHGACDFCRDRYLAAGKGRWRYRLAWWAFDVRLNEPGGRQIAYYPACRDCFRFLNPQRMP